MKDKRPLQVFTTMIVILLTCAAALSVLLLPVTARAAAPSGLHVVGNQIEDGSNHVIVPHGIDRMGTEYQCTKTASNADLDHAPAF